jgi:hypothetical protein
METHKEVVDWFYQEISKLPKEQQEGKIIELYRYLYESFREGKIGRKDMAYIIAGTMQFEVTNQGKLKSVSELAGELELPDG